VRAADNNPATARRTSALPNYPVHRSSGAAARRRARLRFAPGVRHLRRRPGAARRATISTRSYPAQLINVSRWLPSPAVIVLTCDRLAVTGHSGCSMVNIAAVLARLVASPLIAFWVAARRCRRCGSHGGRGGWRGSHSGRGGWRGSHSGGCSWRGGNLRRRTRRRHGGNGGTRTGRQEHCGS
jgi:hypothetical protein